MLFQGRVYIAMGPWYFGNYRNIFPPNIGEEQKKFLPSKRGSPGSVAYPAWLLQYVNEKLR